MKQDLAAIAIRTERHASVPRYRAEDLVYEAWEATGPRRAVLARKALALWPDCADGYVLLAQAASSLEEARELLERGVAAGERAVGRRVFVEDAGQSTACIRCCHSVRCCDSVCRQRTRARRSSRCAGGIHDSASRPINNSSRRCRASAQSVFAPLLLAFERARLRRLSQMHIGADPLEFLDHEPPARRRFQRHLEILALKPGQELPDPGAIRRRDPRARDLPGDRVDPLSRDLSAVLIHAHHERHQTTTPSIATTSTSTRTRAAKRAAHRIPSTTAGTPCSNRRPRGCNHARLPMPFDAEDRPPSPPDYTPPGTYHLSPRCRRADERRCSRCGSSNATATTVATEAYAPSAKEN